MNAPLRKVGVVVMILFGLLFANLNWVQVYKSDEYTANDYHLKVAPKGGHGGVAPHWPAFVAVC